MPITGFKIHPADNVATLLVDGEPGPMSVRDGETVATVVAREPIALGHKIALADIAPGDAIVKFGVAIGTASLPIRCGDWIHLHNCRSGFDERSGTFDLYTGATTDVTYD